MRIAVLITGFLGMIPPAILACILLAERAEENANLPEMKKQAQDTGKEKEFQEHIESHNRITQSAYFILMAIPLGLFGTMLAFTGRGISGGALMLVTALGPALLIPELMRKLVVFGFSLLLVLGGILAFLVQPPPAQPRHDSWDDEEDQRRPRGLARR
jgi:hypothetical protein